jgi:hypothetical protein
MKRVWSIVSSTLAISFGFLAGSLRTQFVYVANQDGTVSGYGIDHKTAVLTLSPFRPSQQGQ